MAPVHIEVFVEARDSELLMRLIDERRRIAADEGRLETEIVETNVLQGIAAMKPTAPEQVARVPGMADAVRYAPQFLKVVGGYLEQQITQPDAAERAMRAMPGWKHKPIDVSALPQDVREFARRLKAHHKKRN
jgi:hypothetical protein